jgi:hypothetical protein
MTDEETNGGLNLLALVKGPERYVFLYDDASRAEVLHAIGRFASNTDLSLTWYDAAILSERVRRARAAHGWEATTIPRLDREEPMP